MIEKEISVSPSFTTPENEYTPQFERSLDVLIDLAGYNSAGEPNTYGATPLDKLSTMHQQADLLAELSIAVHLPPYDVPHEIGEFVSETFRNRFIARGEANDENYRTALLNSRYYSDNPKAMHLIDRAEQGFASPAELILVRQMLGIRSVELACLTHPYGRRIKPGLDQMRSAVGSGVKLMGGVVYENPEPKLRIKEVILRDVPADKMAEVYSKTDRERLAIADQYGSVAGILITRKRTLGMMPDGTVIKERSSLILRGDAESYLTASDLQSLADYPYTKQWEDEAVENTAIKDITLKLLEDDEHSHAIPISTTIYAHNQTTADEVMKNQLANPYAMTTDEHMHMLHTVLSEDPFKTRRVRMLGQMVIIDSQKDSTQS